MPAVSMIWPSLCQSTVCTTALDGACWLASFNREIEILPGGTVSNSNLDFSSGSLERMSSSYSCSPSLSSSLEPAPPEAFRCSGFSSGILAQAVLAPTSLPRCSRSRWVNSLPPSFASSSVFLSFRSRLFFRTSTMTSSSSSSLQAAFSTAPSARPPTPVSSFALISSSASDSEAELVSSKKSPDSPALPARARFLLGLIASAECSRLPPMSPNTASSSSSSSSSAESSSSLADSISLSSSPAFRLRISWALRSWNRSSAAATNAGRTGLWPCASLLACIRETMAASGSTSLPSSVSLSSSSPSEADEL
mmetsp:Transcript_10723/g.34235  ORF Transcript_10723/g.34235 Transcript_10723/m.34235 type:complete len:309 (+) Transcript_10723:943-1869(+)